MMGARRGPGADGGGVAVVAAAGEGSGGFAGVTRPLESNAWRKRAASKAAAVRDGRGDGVGLMATRLGGAILFAISTGGGSGPFAAVTRSLSRKVGRMSAAREAAAHQKGVGGWVATGSGAAAMRAGASVAAIGVCCALWLRGKGAGDVREGALDGERAVGSGGARGTAAATEGAAGRVGVSDRGMLRTTTCSMMFGSATRTMPGRRGSTAPCGGGAMEVAPRGVAGGGCCS